MVIVTALAGLALAASQLEPRSDALPDAPPATSSPRSTAAPIQMYKIVLVGDSTVAPVSGWGGAFCATHVAPSVACLNLARGGRSTRSYREEGSWDAALAEASVPGYAGTFVLIQFGHNDGNPRMRVRTSLDTEYGENLRKFIEDVRAAGAVPVLVTPMVRRLFGDRGLHNSLEPWAERMRIIARERAVPIVDLNQLSAKLVSELGKEGSTALAQRSNKGKMQAGPAGFEFRLRPDITHLGPEGAQQISAIVARALAEAVSELAPLLAP